MEEAGLIGSCSCSSDFILVLSRAADASSTRSAGRTRNRRQHSDTRTVHPSISDYRTRPTRSLARVSCCDGRIAHSPARLLSLRPPIPSHSLASSLQHRLLVGGARLSAPAFRLPTLFVLLVNIDRAVCSANACFPAVSLLTISFAPFSFSLPLETYFCTAASFVSTALSRLSLLSPQHLNIGVASNR